MRRFDEMYARLPEGSDAGEVRQHYEAYARWLAAQDPQVMQSRREEAEVIFRRVGITFAVYGDKDEDGSGTERLIPFDLIPRIIPAHEWKSMEAGLVQRVTALNRFIHDIYHDQEILKAGVIPREQIEGMPSFAPKWSGWMCRTRFIPTSAASTSCVPRMRRARASTTCSKTTCVCPAA